jgi:hypothetical protein
MMVTIYERHQLHTSEKSRNTGVFVPSLVLSVTRYWK